MSNETVAVDWVRDQVFLMQDRSGFPIVMTQPGGVNGADLLPLSVIGCAVWDIASILQKQRQQLTGLQATAESLRDEQPPWRFRRIHIHYKFTGRDLDENQIRRAIELSETKYCATYATLRDCVEITRDYEIVNE
ncbi:MAG: OsmC family protein [Anaerolineales bacterium]|jgi:putative redox protein|nr:OsmC family protein [Anaerolineales bacterium]